MEMLTLDETAQKLGLSHQRVYDLVATGKIKSIQKGKRLHLVSIEEVERVMEDRKKRGVEKTKALCKRLRKKGFENRRTGRRGWYFEDEFYGQSAKAAYKEYLKRRKEK